MMNYSQTKKQRSERREGERGSALIEALIGLMMITFVALAAGQLLRVQIDPMLMAERQRKAGKQAEALLNDLATRWSGALIDGGSFATDSSGNPIRNSDGTISLNCSTSYCDQIIATPQTSGTEMILTRADWSNAETQGTQQFYVRAWSVGTSDDSRGLRRITVAVFPSGDNMPLSVQTIKVVLRKE
jgi:type II secretory pathway pseudopilin PulG